MLQLQWSDCERKRTKLILGCVYIFFGGCALFVVGEVLGCCGFCGQKNNFRGQHCLCFVLNVGTQLNCWESESRGFFLCRISKCGSFQNLILFGRGFRDSGVGDFLSMPNFKMWLLFSKSGFLLSGIWEFGATGTIILIFLFRFKCPWTIQKRLAVLASEGTRKAIQKRLAQLDYRRV